MTREELLELIADCRRRDSELDAVEVKSAHRGTPRHLEEPVSAFANRTGGGVLLLGLDENRDFKIVGVGDCQRLQEEIAHVARDMEPALRPEFTVQVIDGCAVMAVEVADVAAELRPCYYKPRGLQNGSFIRVGNTNRRMTDYEIFGYVSARTQPTFDEQPVVEATLEDLEPARLEAYLRDLRRNRPEAPFLDLPRDRVLLQVGIATRVGTLLHPTLAGLLAFGAYPQAFEPQLVVTFLQFYGVTEDETTPRGERFLDNRKFEGTIPEVVENTVRHVMVSLRKSSLIEGMYRRDIPEYPEEAVREALVNAVAHRDYSNYARGSYIQVRLFADRLEVQSPGGLYGNVTEETLDSEHSTRNRTLMRIMEDLHIAENRGSGIASMIRAMRDATLEPPRFQDRRNSFWVTFRSHSLMNPETVAWLNQFRDRRLNDRQRVALGYLRHNPTITNREYQRLNHVESVTANRELRGLVHTGLLEQHETRRWAHYVLSPEVARSNEEVRVVSYVRQHGWITNAQCRQELNLQRHQALLLLRRMVGRGLLRRAGRKRGTRYVLA